MKAEPIYAKSAPRIRAARMARPLPIAPDSAIGPSNHCRVSATKAKGEMVPAWPPPRAGGRGYHRPLVLPAKRQIMIEPVVRLVHDLVHCERRRGPFGMRFVVG